MMITYMLNTERLLDRLTVGQNSIFTIVHILRILYLNTAVILQDYYR